MQASPASASKPPVEFAVNKFNEYHALASRVPNGSAIFHKGACIFYTGLIVNQANGICGDLTEIEEKIHILKQKNIRFSIFCPADTTLKISGVLGKASYEAFWMPFSLQPIDQAAGTAHKVDADHFNDWNEFCTKNIKDKSFKAIRLRFFQQIIISQIPISHWIYKVNNVILAALSTLILKDTLMILNASADSGFAFNNLAQEAINHEKDKGLSHVITYLTPVDLKLPNSLSIWSYHVHLMF